MTRGRVEQLEASVGDGRKQLVERLCAGDRLTELRQVLELPDPATGLLVEPGVLDRARHEGGARDEEVDLALGELTRCLGVERHGSDRGAVLGEDRHRDERLKLLLGELGDVLEAGIGERVLSNERRLAVLDRPPGEALAPFERDVPDEVGIGLRGSPHHEPPVAVLGQVDEAGRDVARVGQQPDDCREHLVELERGRNRRDDLGQETRLGCGRVRCDRSILDGRSADGARGPDGSGPYEPAPPRRSS